jgi:hypothetical protein
MASRGGPSIAPVPRNFTGPRFVPTGEARRELLEDHAALTRTGTDGVAQIATKGLIAAEFEHWDSRAGDPNLHTHVAISSKVLGVDGTWHALDARPLYRMSLFHPCYPWSRAV